MTRPELVHSLVCVGANYTNDAQTTAANALFDAEILEREHPEFAAALAGFHDPHHHPGYWRELVDQIKANLAMAPACTEADLAHPGPDASDCRETDPWANLDQMLTMRRAIPQAEMLILNHAEWTMANHLAVRPSRRRGTGRPGLPRSACRSSPCLSWTAKGSARAPAASGPTFGAGVVAVARYARCLDFLCHECSALGCNY